MTRLLRAAGDGDPDARDRLMPQLYGELRMLAHRQLSDNRPADRTLCTTALVHEAFLRMASQQDISFQDRAHFLGYAACAMRSVVVDQARRQRAERHGASMTRVSWSDQASERGARPEQVLALDQALQRLAKVDRRLADVAELRVFGGLTQEECSQVLDVSPRTVARIWRKARAMLGGLIAVESER